MTQTQAINGTALAVRDGTDLAPRFVVSLDELRLQLRELEQFKRDIMVEGIDYGTIPGTPKPTLLKPGAEKLSLAFGLAPTFEPAHRVEDWDRGFFHYEERCVLTNKRTGDVVASANGSANGKEPRYRWRDSKPACLNCGRDLRRSRNRDGEQGEPGWYCWVKAGGCGATFPAAQITGPTGRVENPEPYELTNTILKMAQKRALVAAVLIATGGSGTWTQDIEDMPSVTGEDRQVIDVTPQQQPIPRTARQVEPQAQPKVTDTKCSDCDSAGIERMVENESVLKDSLKRYGAALCVQHINEALRRPAADYKRIHGNDDDWDRHADGVPVRTTEAPLYQEYARVAQAAIEAEIDVEFLTPPVTEQALRDAIQSLTAKMSPIGSVEKRAASRKMEGKAN